MKTNKKLKSRSFTHARPRRAGFPLPSRGEGFTLFELIVSFSIVAIIAGVVVANFRQAERTNRLKQATQGLESKIREIRTMTIASSLVNDTLPLGGYGLHFNSQEPTSYMVFADFNGDFTYDQTEELEVVNLPTDIIIHNVAPEQEMTIVFNPPKPKIYLNQELEKYNYFAVTLQQQITKEVKVITFNTISSQIEVK